MMDERYVNAYTRWIKSATTKQVIERAQAYLINQVHAIDDSTVVGAVKAHYFRRGAEVILNHLLTQPTSDMLEQLQKTDAPDYGAEAQVREDLFMEGE